MIEKLLKRIFELGLAVPEELVGCSDQEISQLEEKYQVKLPESYKEFLLTMGKNFGRLVDTNEYRIDYDSVMTMTEKEQKFIDECKAEGENVADLPKNTIIILGRSDGTQFYLIEAQDNTDSPVFYYNSDTEIVEKEFDSFWDVLKMFIAGPKVW